MGAMKEVFVPDIGDFKSVDVIEILVKPGDTVQPEQSLVTLESDKATMEIPSPSAGVVKEVRVKVGDKVSEGTAILVLESAEAAKSAAATGLRTAAPPRPRSRPMPPEPRKRQHPPSPRKPRPRPPRRAAPAGSTFPTLAISRALTSSRSW